MRIIALVLLLCCVCISCLHAEEFYQSTVNATRPALAAAVAAAYFSDTKHEGIGINRAARVTDAILISHGLAEAIKGKSGTFPSDHAAITFAAASSLAKVYPKQRYLIYGAACFLGYSIVKSDNHTAGEVLGGAALGMAIGNWSMSSRDGLVFGRTFRF
jgi:membrane-associated phospholipid phosphatase